MSARDDKLWIKDPRILIEAKRISEIVPSGTLPPNRRANAVVRLVAIGAAILASLQPSLIQRIMIVAAIIIIASLVMIGGTESFEEYKPNLYHGESIDSLDVRPEPSMSEEQPRRFHGSNPINDIMINRPQMDLSRVGRSPKNGPQQWPDPLQDRNIPVDFRGSHRRPAFRAEGFTPYDNRMMRRLGQAKGDDPAGMRTEFASLSNEDMMGTFRSKIGGRGAKGKLVPIRRGHMNAEMALNAAFNHNSDPREFQDHELKAFRDNYTRGRLRAAIGESNVTSGGYRYGAPQISHIYDKLPKMTYLDEMGIYE